MPSGFRAEPVLARAVKAEAVAPDAGTVALPAPSPIGRTSRRPAGFVPELLHPDAASPGHWRLAAAR